jgi:hypothetical protein
MTGCKARSIAFGLINSRTKHHAVHVQAVEEKTCYDIQTTKIDAPVFVAAVPHLFASQLVSDDKKEFILEHIACHRLKHS